MAKTEVVILNWNGIEHLKRFLPSVVDNTPKSVEIVVADNGSSDNSVNWLNSNYPNVRIIALDKNYGFTGGYNRALSQGESSDADYFVLLNSDVETPKGWVEPLIELMESDDNIAAVAPKIISYGDKTQFDYAGAAGGFIDGLGYPFCRGRILSTIEEDKGQYNDTREVFWASGACLMFRASVWRELGGLDEDFFAHMEEIDLCWRAQLAGYKIMIEPKSFVYHLGGGTLSATNPKKTYLNFRNNLAMLYKNLSKRSMPWVLFTRMVLDGGSALVYLLTGKPKLFSAVFRSHIDFWKWRSELKVERRKIQKMRESSSTQIYSSSIIFRYIFGKKTFGNLM